jgi:hypothetical protein
MSSKEYETAYAQGNTLIAFRDKQMSQQISKSIKQEFLGHKALIMFTNCNASHVGNKALEEEKIESFIL